MEPVEERNSEAGGEARSFYVAGVPPVVFNADPETSIRPEFESIFRGYGEEVRFTYLKSFGRVRVTYPDHEQCRMAWSDLREQEFRGNNLQLKPVRAFMIGSEKLELPKRSKTFLISPPASPPVGWEQTQEATPTTLNYNLVSALASLQLPGEVQELHEATERTPGIVVVTPSDPGEETPSLIPSVCRDEAATAGSGPRMRMNALPRHLVQTARPPLSQSS